MESSTTSSSRPWAWRWCQPDGWPRPPSALENGTLQAERAGARMALPSRDAKRLGAKPASRTKGRPQSSGKLDRPQSAGHIRRTVFRSRLNTPMDAPCRQSGKRFNPRGIDRHPLAARRLKLNEKDGFDRSQNFLIDKEQQIRDSIEGLIDIHLMRHSVSIRDEASQHCSKAGHVRTERQQRPQARPVGTSPHQ